LNQQETNTTGKSMNAYLSEGTYYIRVTTDDYWHSTADYTLCVNYTENQGEYEIEPNNSQDNATLIEVERTGYRKSENQFRC